MGWEMYWCWKMMRVRRQMKKMEERMIVKKKKKKTIPTLKWTAPTTSPKLPLMIRKIPSTSRKNPSMSPYTTDLTNKCRWQIYWRLLPLTCSMPWGQIVHKLYSMRSTVNLKIDTWKACC
uniref:Uncharacterized protein n=1 Tax=Cacopsylla melanoneura TaxID=428564 RepID=A0A8D8RN84_9HEMI